MGHQSRINPVAQQAKQPRPDAVLDARGRALQEGDEVFLAVQGPIYFRIATIVPNLHPQAPPGMMKVDLGSIISFAAQKGVINPEFVRVRTAEEAGDSPFFLATDAQKRQAAAERQADDAGRPEFPLDPRD